MLPDKHQTASFKCKSDPHASPSPLIQRIYISLYDEA